MTLYINVSVLPGTDIDDAARQALELSRQLSVGVKFSFNGVEMLVFPGQTTQQVCQHYHNEICKPDGSGDNMADPSED